MTQYTCPICKTQFYNTHHSVKYCDSCRNGSEDTSIIYGLHNGNGEVRYIGSTKSPARRLMQHRWNQECGNTALHRWIAETGQKLSMEIIAKVSTEQAKKHEEEAMRVFLSGGARLFNKRQARRKIYQARHAHKILSARFDADDDLFT